MVNGTSKVYKNYIIFIYFVFKPDFPKALHKLISLFSNVQYRQWSEGNLESPVVFISVLPEFPIQFVYFVSVQTMRTLQPLIQPALQNAALPAMGRVPQFSGILDVLKMKQGELVLKDDMAKKTQELRRQDEEKQALQVFEQQLDQIDLLHGPVLEFQGKPVSGLNVLHIVQELSQQNSFRNKLENTGLLAFVGVLFVGIPFLFPSYLKHFKEKGWAAGAEDYNIARVLYVPNQNNYGKLQCVLKRLQKEGYLQLSLGAQEGGVLDRRWLLTEKCKKILTANPTSDIQLVQNFLSDGGDPPAQKALTPNTLTDTLTLSTSLATSGLQRPRANPMLKHLKALFLKETGASSGWDTLQQLAQAVQGKSALNRWAAPGVRQSVLTQQAGKLNPEKLQQQLDALKALDLITTKDDGSVYTEKTIWRITERGKQLAAFSDPFAAGLMSENLLEEIIRQEIDELKLSVDVGAHSVEALAQEVTTATDELETMKLQQLETETEALKLEENPAHRDQAGQKARSAQNLKRMVTLKEELLTRLNRKSALTQANQTQRVHRVEATVQKLQEMILRARTAKVNKDLLQLSDELQRIQREDSANGQGNPLLAGIESPVEESYFRSEAAVALSEPDAGSEDIETALSLLRATTTQPGQTQPANTHTQKLS